MRKQDLSVKIKLTDPVFLNKVLLLYNTGTVKEADICWIYIAVSNVMKKYDIQVIIQVLFIQRNCISQYINR